MINCTKVKKMLNEAIIKGMFTITIPSLSLFEKQELEECGYFIKKDKKGNYIISQ